MTCFGEFSFKGSGPSVSGGGESHDFQLTKNGLFLELGVGK